MGRKIKTSVCPHSQLNNLEQLEELVFYLQKKLSS